LCVLHKTQANLLQVALARRPTGVFTRTGEDREENRREDRYYGYDDKQFYEREALIASVCD
jgi:hypothetical protein